MATASGGYDVPSFKNMKALKTWAEEGPPKHYPNPLSIAAAPAPAKIAQQIYAQGLMTKMLVRHMRGEAMDQTLAWAETDVEGFMRS